MQKYTEPCINTSSFAKLCNTNKRTLIHYDEIGLFKPAFTDERGYRYYSETQCDLFFTITCLKDLGMPLKEIKQYVTDKNPSDLTALLLEQQQKVEKEIRHLKRIEQVINNKLNLVSEGMNIHFDGDGCSEPFTADFPEETYLTTPFLGTSEHEELFAALCEHIREVNHHFLSIGHAYGAMMQVADLETGAFDRYANFMTKISSAAPHAHLPVHQKAAGSYAVLYLRGDYYEADHAFEKLLNYIHQNSLIPGKYCYKEAIWDELTVEKKEAYITRISIPVC